jgi:hypothetical protein
VRRRNRLGVVRFLGILLLGGLLGAAVWSVVQRVRAPLVPLDADAALTVEVLNGCGSPGAGERVAALLRRGGFQVTHVGNADHFHYREDVVVCRTVGRDRGIIVSRWLKDAPVVEQRIEGHAADITVIAGKPRPLGVEK